MEKIWLNIYIIYVFSMFNNIYQYLTICLTIYPHFSIYIYIYTLEYIIYVSQRK